MSIAEMITQGTKQQSQNWSVLSENLGRLGQQVGQQLAMREYQKQAAEALPAMQAAYRSAMDDVSRGSVSEGYRKFMDAQFQFGTSQNPLISGQAQLIGGNFTDFVATLEKQKQRQAQYGGGGVGGGRGASLLDMYSGGDQLDVDGGELPIDGGFDASVGGEGANIIAEDLGTGFGAGTTGNFAFQMEGYQRPSKEIETTANKEFDQYSSGDTASQESYRTSVMSPQVPKGTEFVEQPGLNRFKGFEQVTGIFVPKEKSIDFPNYSVRKDGKGAISETLTFNKKTINEEQRKKSTELAYNDLPTAIGRISSNQALEKYFIENKVEDLDIGSEKDDLGEVSYYIGVRGDEESRMPIEQDDYISATVIRKLPSTSKTFGAPLAITQAKEQAAPAAAQPAAGEKKERFPEKKGKAPSSPQVAAPTAPAKEMTLEERISAKTSAPTSTRTATPEQLAGVKAGQVRQQKSSLESEATKLERALYDMPRTGGGKKQLKRGLSAQDPDVKSALQRIAEINKQLEAL